jgi:RNA polymerase sigma factor (sigma-70 family)
MTEDTDLGGAIRAFPATRHSAVRQAANPDPEVRKQAFEELVTAYWKPIYKYIRVKWNASNEDAKDLTQAFFARAMEKEFCQGYDPSRASFRTYLRVGVDGFIANQRKAAGRIKRGGGVPILSLDFDAAEGELRGTRVPAVGNPDDLFHREWVRSLFALAVDELRRDCEASGKQTHFQLFERYDLEGPDAPRKPTYSELGVEFGLSVTQVTNHLAAMRRYFRRLVVARIRATTGSDEEFREESRRLLGGWTE